MSLAVNVAGLWTATAQFPGDGSPTSLGITQDGYSLSWRLFKQTLRRTDKFGNTPIEAFAAGLEMSLSAIFHEWKTTELRLLTITNDTVVTSGAQSFDIGPVGTQDTDSAAVFVLSSVVNTPARTNSFTTMTIPALTVDEDFSVDLTFGPDKLVLPFRGRVWPYLTGGVYRMLATA